MSDFVGIDVAGIDEIVKKLNALPLEAQDQVVDTTSQFMIKSILPIYPPSKYVTRTDAYGTPFFTDKQRRWFFASLADGSISVPYKRTQGLAHSWKQIGTGVRSFIANDSPGAEFVVGEKQSRHEQKVGWLKVDETIQRHIRRIVSKADEAIRKAIKKLNLD